MGLNLRLGLGLGLGLGLELGLRMQQLGKAHTQTPRRPATQASRHPDTQTHTYTRGSELQATRHKSEWMRQRHFKLKKPQLKSGDPGDAGGGGGEFSTNELS